MHGSVREQAQQSVSYAEQKLAPAFDFAQKLLGAKVAAEITGLQSEYFGRQMQALSCPDQTLRQTAAKIVIDAAKLKTWYCHAALRRLSIKSSQISNLDLICALQ